MNGVDNMNYMYSLNATGNSTTSLIVDFDTKTDPNNDFILAQSRETQAASQLPSDVTNIGTNDSGRGQRRKDHHESARSSILDMLRRLQSHEALSGPVVGIALVLSAVFVPTAKRRNDELYRIRSRSRCAGVRWSPTVRGFLSCRRSRRRAGFDNRD